MLIFKIKTMKDIYQEVTDKIIAQLESGTIPWKKPWNSTTGLRPQNYQSGHVYKGINYFLLSLISENPYWLTFNQVRKMGGKVKKGSKSSIIVFWKFLYKDKDGKPCEQVNAANTIPLLRYYNVFNASDIEGIDFVYPDPPEPNENKRIENCEALLKATKATFICQDKNRAYYSPILDHINLPPLDSFHNADGYYSTAFHELAHWTGHKTRLNRFKGDERFGNTEYSKEELIAEMTAAFLCNENAITQTVENSAAYIKAWLSVLKDDNKMLISAAGKAEKAAEFINGFLTVS